MTQDNLEFSNACLYRLYHATRGIPVIKRLYPSLLKAWARLTWSEGYKVKRYRGVLFLLNYQNQIDRKVGLHGGYEREACATTFAILQNNGCDLFLDIGASIGVYALQVAQRGLAKEIHAFDPDPRNYAHLSFNVYLNNFSDILQAHAVAVSDVSGSVQFEMAEKTKTLHSQVVTETRDDTGKSSMGRLVSGSGTMREVQARALDDMFAHKDKKIFLKINIQGHESSALKGAERLLRENTCFLLIWMWHKNRENVLQQLSGLGYKLTHADQGGHYADQGYYYLEKA